MPNYRKQIREVQANMRAGEGNKARQQNRIEFLREQQAAQRQARDDRQWVSGHGAPKQNALTDVVQGQPLRQVPGLGQPLSQAPQGAGPQPPMQRPITNYPGISQEAYDREYTPAGNPRDNWLTQYGPNPMGGNITGGYAFQGRPGWKVGQAPGTPPPRPMPQFDPSQIQPYFRGPGFDPSSVYGGMNGPALQAANDALRQVPPMQRPTFTQRIPPNQNYMVRTPSVSGGQMGQYQAPVGLFSRPPGY